MQVSEIKNKERVINELILFIRKVFDEPQICEIAKEIARKHIDQPDANQLIAEELSATHQRQDPHRAERRGPAVPADAQGPGARRAGALLTALRPLHSGSLSHSRLVAPADNPSP